MKNILSENMIRFGTKNLSESQKQKLSEQSADPAGLKNQGIAMKIVGLLMKAMGGFTMSSGVTDEQGILKAVYMIKDKTIYDAVLREVQVGAAVKKEYGRNYPTIGSWISTDLTMPGAGSVRAAVTKDEDMVYEIERHLKQFNKNEKIASAKGLHGTNTDERDFRGARSRRAVQPWEWHDPTPDDAGGVMRF